LITLSFQVLTDEPNIFRKVSFSKMIINTYLKTIQHQSTYPAKTVVLGIQVKEFEVTFL